MSLISIIPPESSEPGSLTTWTGTKVVDAKGVEIEGVTKIEIVIERDQIASAVIHCAVVPVPMCGLQRVDFEGYRVERPVSWWRKVLMSMAGFCYDESGLKMASTKKRI